MSINVSFPGFGRQIKAGVRPAVPDHGPVLRWASGASFDRRAVTAAAIRAARSAGLITIRRVNLSPRSQADYEEVAELTAAGRAALSPSPSSMGRR